jgi:hypothetical protein
LRRFNADSSNHVHENINVPSKDLMPALLAREKESVNKVMIFFNTSMFAELPLPREGWM